MRVIDPAKRKLTDIECKNAMPRLSADGELKPRKLSDGHGLNLEIRKDGKFWYYAFRHMGKQLKLNLGPYPSVSIDEAREMHEQAWALVRNGDDPRNTPISYLHRARAKAKARAV